MNFDQRFRVMAVLGAATLFVAVAAAIVLSVSGGDSDAGPDPTQAGATGGTRAAAGTGFFESLAQRLIESAEIARVQEAAAQGTVTPGAEGVSVGTVVEVDATTLEIATYAGQDFRFTITADTAIIRRGETISPAELEEGETVMVVSMDESTAFGVYAFGMMASPNEP